MTILLIAMHYVSGLGLTLFSGFGLGTLLLPAMAISFPIDTAMALTAIVHSGLKMPDMIYQL